MRIKKNNLTVFFDKKLKGGALYVAMIVGIVIGIILSLFILASRYNQKKITVFSQSSQLYYNLKSAFEIAKSDYFTDQNNDHWFKNTNNDDSIKIKKINWGAYLIIAATTKNRHQKLTQSGLFGTYLCSDTGLVVSDNSRPVGLSGKVIFNANCYLPQAGIKPAYIEGQSYLSHQGNAGFIKASTGQVPQVNENFSKAIRIQQNEISPVTDSLVSNLPQTVKHSFNNKTIVCEINSSQLKNVNYANNIKLTGQEITIDNSCLFDNVLIICKKVRFKEGFKGSVHVIASDSIILGKNCELVYPSSLVLRLNEDNSNALKCIQFNAGSKFSGGIIAFNDSPSQNSGKTFIQLNATSEINGLVYSSDYLHVEGKINGTLICGKLLLKTPSAVYENHILGCEINPKELAHNISVPMLFNKEVNLFCCKNF